MQTLKWQDQNNLHHTGDRRQRQMSHIVTTEFFGESEAWSGAGQWRPAAEGSWRHILVAWSSMQCFRKLWGSLVSLSSPKTTRCAGQTARVILKPTKIQSPVLFTHDKSTLGKLENNILLLICPCCSSCCDLELFHEDQLFWGLVSVGKVTLCCCCWVLLH